MHDTLHNQWNSWSEMEIKLVCDWSSHLLIDDVVQVWDADVSFNQGDLVHLLGERPLFNVVLDSNRVVGSRPALGNKHLLWCKRNVTLWLFPFTTIHDHLYCVT